jgi:phage terminase large subunit-like protein
MADGCGIGRRVCPARNTDHYPFDKCPPGQVLFMLMMLGGAAHVVAVGGSPSL